MVACATNNHRVELGLSPVAPETTVTEIDGPRGGPRERPTRLEKFPDFSDGGRLLTLSVTLPRWLGAMAFAGCARNNLRCTRARPRRAMPEITTGTTKGFLRLRRKQPRQRLSQIAPGPSAAALGHGLGGLCRKGPPAGQAFSGCAGNIRGNGFRRMRQEHPPLH